MITTLRESAVSFYSAYKILRDIPERHYQQLTTDEQAVYGEVLRCLDDLVKSVVARSADEQSRSWRAERAARLLRAPLAPEILS